MPGVMEDNKMRVEIWANCNIRKTHIRIRIKNKIKNK